jgi:glycopeptide antibiotics resistance protein
MVPRRIADYFFAFLWILGWGVFGFPRRRLSVAPRFDRLDWVTLFYVNPRDVLLNFAYYVLFGIIATRLGVRPPIAVGIAALLSALTEFSQLFSRSRYPTITDLVVNTAGAFAGILLVQALQRRRARQALLPNP